MRHYMIMSGVQMTGLSLGCWKLWNPPIACSQQAAFGLLEYTPQQQQVIDSCGTSRTTFQTAFKSDLNCLFIVHYTNKGGIFFFIRNNKNKGPSALIRMPCLNLVLLSRSWPPTFIPSLAQPITIIEVFSRHERLVLGELFQVTGFSPSPLNAHNRSPFISGRLFSDHIVPDVLT